MPEPAPPPDALDGCAKAFFTKLVMSSLRMRSFGPLPLTRARSTPNSRAKRRTEGLA